MRSSAKVESPPRRPLLQKVCQTPVPIETLYTSLYGYRSYTCCKDNRTQMCLSIVDGGFTYSGHAVSICFNRWSFQASVIWYVICGWLQTLTSLTSLTLVLTMHFLVTDDACKCIQPISWVPELGSFEKGSATCTADHSCLCEPKNT